jgi:ADP-ribose pyrophosphatase YjhB (NUDIX family)
MLFVRDTVWGDLTLVGGHEEPGDDKNLERTARREVEEELGRLDIPFRLIPLTDEIRYGPTWSESTKMIKSYIFMYYGIEFEGNPKIEVEQTDKGFALEMIREENLPHTKDLSNVVKILLDRPEIDLQKVPVSWKIESAGATAECKAAEGTVR